MIRHPLSHQRTPNPYAPDRYTWLYLQVYTFEFITQVDTFSITIEIAAWRRFHCEQVHIAIAWTYDDLVLSFHIA